MKKVVFFLSIMMTSVWGGNDKAFRMPMHSPLTNSSVNNRSILRNPSISRPPTPFESVRHPAVDTRTLNAIEELLNSEELTNGNNQDFSQIDHDSAQNTMSISYSQNDPNFMEQHIRRQFNTTNEPRIVQLFNQRSFSPVMRLQTCIHFCVTTSVRTPNQTLGYIRTYPVNSILNSAVFGLPQNLNFQNHEVFQRTIAPYNSTIQPSAPSIDLLNAPTSQTTESSNDEDDIPLSQTRRKRKASSSESLPKKGKRKSETSASRPNTKKRR